MYFADTGSRGIQQTEGWMIAPVLVFMIYHGTEYLIPNAMTGQDLPSDILFQIC